MENLRSQVGVMETIILFIKTTTRARRASYRLLKHTRCSAIAERLQVAYKITNAIYTF